MRLQSVRALALGWLLGGALALSAGGAMAAPYKILHQFCAKDCRDGFGLQAPLVRDARGNLYGTASQGGRHGAGTVFRLHPLGAGRWRFDVLHDFCVQARCQDGASPESGLIVAQDGSLYGVAAADPGSDGGDAVVFRLRPQGGRWHYKVLYRFCHEGVCDGTFANTALAYPGQATGTPYDNRSPLFGVAGSGGAHGGGVAFMLEPKAGGWKHTDIYQFCSETACLDGGAPSQPLVSLDMFHLAGVASTGGAGGLGAVFRLDSDDGVHWRESIVHDFCSQQPHCADGVGAASGLAMDPAGNLYGTTSSGGDCWEDFACGTLFRIAPDGTDTVLFDFCRHVGGCSVGSDPAAGVVLGRDGTIYGTTTAGGRADAGVIYAFDGTMKRLHNFCAEPGCEFGGNPRSPLIIDPSGRYLYGVTPQGDTSGGGVVFELTLPGSPG